MGNNFEFSTILDHMYMFKKNLGKMSAFKSKTPKIVITITSQFVSGFKQIHTSLDWIFNSICEMSQLVGGCHLNKTYQIEFSSEFIKLFWHPK